LRWDPGGGRGSFVSPGRPPARRLTSVSDVLHAAICSGFSTRQPGGPHRCSLSSLPCQLRLRLSARDTARFPLPLPYSLHAGYRALPSAAAAASSRRSTRRDSSLSRQLQRARELPLALFVWARFELIVEEKLIVDKK
jgi:hypothetical protein